MLRHVIAYRLTDPGEVDFVVDLFRSLRGRIPELVELRVGRNLIPSDRSFDVAIVATFASIDDLERYQEDDYHMEVATEVRKRTAESVAVDFFDPDNSGI